jgi:hypothetical protein
LAESSTEGHGTNNVMKQMKRRKRNEEWGITVCFDPHDSQLSWLSEMSSLSTSEILDY